MTHTSPWHKPAQPAAFGPLRAQRSVDVAVIGAGITGLTTALLAQRNGARVAVIEAESVASGTTGRTTGKVTSQHGEIYGRLTRRHGQDVARLYGAANEAAVGLVAELVSDLDIQCGFARAAAFTYTTDPQSVQRLQEEAETARRLGLPSEFVTETDLPFPVAGAVRFDNQAYFDAARYCGALANEVVAGGGEVYEQSRALRVEWERSPVVVRTPEGAVAADHVVVATLLPVIDIGGFFAKTRPKRSYGIAVRLADNAPASMAISVESPKRSTRPWPAGGPNGLIVVGDGHETGHEQDTQRHYDALEGWTRDVFGEASVHFRWSAQDYSTLDELPYVGRSPRTTHCYVATGFNKWGLSNGTAAAMVLAELINGRESPWLRAFDATRIGDAAAVVKMAKENVHVGKQFVSDRVARLTADSVRDLAAGSGRIVRAGGRAVAAYRDADGTVHAVDATCTHMGCTVRFNDAERSWDCPCHGSRFATNGDVLAGPAVRPLSEVDVEH
ncbi:MAG TPA: FAD-dependent oxidoreductase [Egibacteraceae bacterium]|nr:FAD-dependent oxidoreductase [Egibacteraceae bacterium]